MLYMRLMKATIALAFDVQPESAAEVGGLSDVQAWIDKVFRPPVSVLDVYSNLVWALEYDSSIRLQ